MADIPAGWTDTGTRKTLSLTGTVTGNGATCGPSMLGTINGQSFVAAVGPNLINVGVVFSFVYSLGTVTVYAHPTNITPGVATALGTYAQASQYSLTRTLTFTVTVGPYFLATNDTTGAYGWFASANTIKTGVAALTGGSSVTWTQAAAAVPTDYTNSQIRYYVEWDPGGGNCDTVTQWSKVTVATDSGDLEAKTDLVSVFGPGNAQGDGSGNIYFWNNGGIIPYFVVINDFVAPCPAGQLWCAQTNQCVDAAPPSCADILNCVWSTTQCQWLCDAPVCAVGKVWDPSTCACVDRCPTGQQYCEATGLCTTTTTPDCASQLNCVWSPSACAWVCDTPSCPVGQTWVAAICACVSTTCGAGLCWCASSSSCVDCAAPACSAELNCEWDQSACAWVCDDPTAFQYCGDGTWNWSTCRCMCDSQSVGLLPERNTSGKLTMADKYYPRPFYEADTRLLTWDVNHGACGDPVLTSEVSCIYLTLTDEITGAVINGRNSQIVFNANDGTYTDGSFTWFVRAADTTMVNTDLAEETHLAVIKVVLIDGETRRIEVALRITKAAEPSPVS